MSAYTAADVHAVMEYMQSAHAFKLQPGHYDPDNPFPNNPQASEIYHRGRRVIKEAQLKYSTSSAEAKSAPRDSPIVRKVWRGHSSYYWLRNRSDANAERKGGKSK